jgi:hypothetical protein
MREPTTEGTGFAMPGKSPYAPHWKALFDTTTQIANSLSERPDAQDELDTLWRMIYALWRVYEPQEGER